MRTAKGYFEEKTGKTLDVVVNKGKVEILFEGQKTVDVIIDEQGNVEVRMISNISLNGNGKDEFEIAYKISQISPTELYHLVYDFSMK